MNEQNQMPPDEFDRERQYAYYETLRWWLVRVIVIRQAAALRSAQGRDIRTTRRHQAQVMKALAMYQEVTGRSLTLKQAVIWFRAARESRLEARRLTRWEHDPE